MTLIACDECGHAISQSAMTCPGCGARTRHARQWLGGAVAVLLGAMVIYVLVLTVASERRISDTAAQAPVATTGIRSGS